MARRALRISSILSFMFGAKPKGTFRPYQPSEPQPRGAVTRSPGIAQAPGLDRAVAQRRSRAGGLTRPSAEAIRSGPLRWTCLGRKRTEM